jgi:ribosome biogenesis GTPase / thiamine phosphate phosphatase
MKRSPSSPARRRAAAERRTGTVLVAYQREILVQPGTMQRPRLDEPPVAVALPRALYRQLGRIVVGDEVAFEPGGRGGKPAVTELLPRRSGLYRAAGPGGTRQQLLFSNLELLVVCTSPVAPPFRPGLIDRLLLAAAVQQLEAVVLLNKLDLVEPASAAELLAPYRGLGYRCLATSAESGDGLPELSELLVGRSSALVGHSGAGKSTLVNRLVPEAGLPVGPVAEATGKGQHTTTRSRLLPLPQGGFLLDSPGIRMFGLAGIEPREAAERFPDFTAMAPCRFNDCLHLVEEDCRVREAVGSGELAEERYLSYQRIVHSLDPTLPVSADIEPDETGGDEDEPEPD